MRIVATTVTSLVSLIVIAAVVWALRSSAADGRTDLRMSRADGQQRAVVDAHPRRHRRRRGPVNLRTIDQLQETLTVVIFFAASAL